MVRESTGVWSRIDSTAIANTETQLTELLHPVLAAAGVGVWRYDLNNECFHFDELLRTLYEMEPVGPIERNLIADRIHPLDRDDWLSSLQGRPDGGIYRCRHRVILQDNRERWFDWTGNPSSAGSSDAILGICVDVTDEINIQRKLQADEKRFEALALGVPGSFGYMDRDYLVQFLSRDFCTALGVTASDAIGRHSTEVFGAAVFRKLKPVLDRGLAGELVSFEDSEIGSDGKTRLYAVNYQPDIDQHGQVRGLFTLRVDITSRRELEQNLRKVTASLERSNADLEQFAYVASHDLKAPLRSIEVLVEWLHEDLRGFSDGDVQENLGLLGKRAARLNKLLEDLLEYSRVGRSARPPEAVDVGSLVEEISELMNADNAFRISLHGPSLTMHTDPAALHQVLRNLIGNAMKHHPGPGGEVRVSIAERDLVHEITVADDGAGIPEKFWERIFMMFQTLKPRDEVEGSGMGLAIVQRIVRNHGGKIWLEKPAQGSGAVFKFTWARKISE